MAGNRTVNKAPAGMLVVVGASAGGMEALTQLVAQLPEDFPAPVFIVNHMGPETTGDVLVEALNSNGPLPCGGVLWQMKVGKSLRYRCHTGHAFTSAVLLATQTAKVEETLWIALRMFEERQNLIATMGDSKGGLASSVLQRVQDSQVHIDRIRAMLMATDNEASGKPTGLEKPKGAA